MRQFGATAAGAVSSLFCALILLAAGHARADAPAPRNFDIPSQSLASALSEFGRQSQQTILFAPSVVAQKHSAGVHGEMEPLAALQVLLRESGLSSVTTPNGAILVDTAQALAQRAQPKSAAGKSTQSSDDVHAGADRKSLWERLRLARVDMRKAADDDAIGPGNSAAASKPASVDEVVVTGSRIPIAAKQQAQPVVVYTSEDIDRSGQTTVTDFLNNMPQMSITSNPGGFQTFASQRGVQLHGLPLGTTLVLLDGQRTDIGSSGSFDLSMIPAAAIDRVEVIPVGTSAVYGSDALAGVVNMVLKRHFNGVEANIKYGSATGTDDLSGNIAMGKDWQRGSVSLVLSGQHQSELAAYERPETRTTDFTSRGGQNYNWDACDPGTVYALNGQTLNGLGTTSAAIPAGLTGKPTIADFVATAGKVNQCNSSSNSALIPASLAGSALLSGRFALTPSIELFGTVLYSHFETRPDLGTLFNMPGGSYYMSASNPYNPFGQDIGVGYAYGLWKEDRTQDMIRPTLGLRGDLPRDWHWEVTGLYSHNSSRIVEQIRNRDQYRAALASSDPATALNIFTTGAPASDAVLATFSTLSHDRHWNSLTSGQALVRGPLFTLPSGTVDSVFGVTHDRYLIRDLNVEGDDPTGISSRARNATAFFTEERVPLWANTNNPADGEILALSVAARWDHSSDFGGKATYQGGLEWRPVGGLLVRGAYGTSYRAPQLPQLYGVTERFAQSIPDPARGNTSNNVEDYSFGPNPNLRPETGDSTSVGLVYSSRELPGLESSLTWWKINYDNYIGYPSYLDVINYPTAFPSGLIERAAPTADDIAKGWLGQITAVHIVPVNYGAIQVAGVDFDLSYHLSTAIGRVTPTVAVTEGYKYTVALRPGQPEQNHLGYASLSPGYMPRWKGNVGVNWERSAWSFSVLGRYVGSYQDYADFVPAGGHEIGSIWVFDTNLRYRFGSAFGASSRFKDAYATAGGVNILNRQPSFSFYPTGYDVQQADLRGRFLYIQLGVRL